jgi:phage terminase large subunit
MSFWTHAHFTEKQLEATRQAMTHRYTLYGGSRGPGKSYWLRWYLLYRLINMGQRGLRGVRSMLACEDYPTLRDRQIEKARLEFPRQWGTFFEQAHEFRLTNGNVLCFRNLDDPSKYMSSEWADVGVDELTKQQVSTFNILRASNRWPGVNDPKFIGASNPGGVGHLWVKQYFIDGIYPTEMQEFAEQFCYVKALPDDNPHLPASYWKELETLPPDLARAWRHGDWNVFEGQAFSEWREDKHVVKPFVIPDAWVKWRAVDWGHHAPWCCLWLAQEPDSQRVYVYREAYQTKLTDREQATRIKSLTMDNERIRMTLADPAMWTRKTHENTTFSTADEYQAAGVFLTQADNDRIQGVRKVREMLMDGEDGKPRMQIFSTCANLVRTLPALPYDKVRIEDVDSNAEDHAFDALKYGLMRGTMVRVSKPQVQEDVYAFAG